MSLPPAAKRPPTVVYPQIESDRLRNGLTVVCIQDDHLPRVSVRLAFPTGETHSPDDCLGISQVAVEALKTGTLRRSAVEIADFLDHWAIEYDAEVALEYTILTIVQLQSCLEKGLTLLSEFAMQPSFPASELEKIKVRWKSLLMAQRSDPAFLASERLFMESYRGHPYSKVSIPLAHLEAIEVEAVRDFFWQHFLPRKALLVFSGAIDMKRAMRLAGRFFGGWSADATSPFAWPQEVPAREPSVSLIDRPSSAQDYILVGVRTVPKAHPTSIPLKVLNQVFGGGGSSRIFLRLREDKGYTYGAYSSLRSLKYDGLLLTGTSVRSGTVAESLDLTFREMETLAQNGPGDAEVTRAQSEIAGAFLRQLETPGSIANLEVKRRLYELPRDYYAKMLTAIRSVSADTVQLLAGDYLSPPRCSVVVVGQREHLEQEMKSFGSVSVFDTEGHRLG